MKAFYYFKLKKEVIPRNMPDLNKNNKKTIKIYKTMG